jgi:hypothetical protein
VRKLADHIAYRVRFGLTVRVRRAQHPSGALGERDVYSPPQAKWGSEWNFGGEGTLWKDGRSLQYPRSREFALRRSNGKMRRDIVPAFPSGSSLPQGLGSNGFLKADPSFRFVAERRGWSPPLPPEVFETGVRRTPTQTASGLFLISDLPSGGCEFLSAFLEDLRYLPDGEKGFRRTLNFSGTSQGPRIKDRVRKLADHIAYRVRFGLTV